MKARENTPAAAASVAPLGFVRVRDSRGRPVKFLQMRGSRYYATMKVEGADGIKKTRRFPLSNPDRSPVRNLTEAGEALAKLRVDRGTDALPTVGRKPMFSTFVDAYLLKPAHLGKKPGTRDNEKLTLALWKAHLGGVRVDKITTPMIGAFQEMRLAGSLKVGGKAYKAVSSRTANLDVVILRNVLNAALDEGHLRAVPVVKKLKERAPMKKRLLTSEELRRLIACCPTACKLNGEQLADYLRFLAYSGAREQEALRIKWEDVNFDGHRLTVGADGDTKNGQSRSVNFTGPLAALLAEMKSRRAPDSCWLFPSPRRGEKDLRASSFKESLAMARDAAGVPWLGFHHLRHYFVSSCVMSGLDFMTIAAWVGHQDGGVLIGKVYGHLADEHKKAAAAKVSFA